MTEDLAPVRDLDHNVALLNRIGEELVIAFRGKGGWSHAITSMRDFLDLSGATLWTIHRPGGEPIKEGEAWSGTLGEAAVRTFDERLVSHQLQRSDRFIASPGAAEAAGLAIPTRLPSGAISLPLMTGRPPVVGVLNLYPNPGFWRAAGPRLEVADEFLRALCGQLAVFVERKELEAGAAINREIHHRVKNNLNTVASLLRIQQRRLDRTTAEQALQESINRILGIAEVHEQLARAESGLVDLAGLVERITKALVAQVADFSGLSVRQLGPRVMLNGAQAMVLALVVNELVQNALDHGAGTRRAGHIDIVIAWTAGVISLIIEDDGAGLPAGFTLDGETGLGLELVEMLTTEELKGTFTLEPRSGGGARAQIVFPPLSRTEWVG